MPLRKDKRRSDASDSDNKKADSNVADAATATNPRRQNDDYEEEEDEAQDAWLESLGIENSEIRKINHSQVRTHYDKHFKFNVFCII